VPVKNADHTNENIIDTNDYSECENEDDKMMTEINNDNNLTVALNKKNASNDAYEVNYFKTYFTEQKPLIQLCY